MVADYGPSSHKPLIVKRDKMVNVKVDKSCFYNSVEDDPYHSVTITDCGWLWSVVSYNKSEINFNYRS